jgi:hypothetical protein
MSDAADGLARSRSAILDQIQPRERRLQSGTPQRRREGDPDAGRPQSVGARGGVGGRFARIRYAAKTWWRYHPAHVGLDLASPALSAYAGRKPLQFLGIAAGVGAVVVVARPWRLISVTGLLLAIAKSSQLSTVLLSALSAVSAADHQKVRGPHE